MNVTVADNGIVRSVCSCMTKDVSGKYLSFCKHNFSCGSLSIETDSTYQIENLSWKPVVYEKKIMFSKYVRLSECKKREKKMFTDLTIGPVFLRSWEYGINRKECNVYDFLLYLNSNSFILHDIPYAKAKRHCVYRKVSAYIKVIAYISKVERINNSWSFIRNVQPVEYFPIFFSSSIGAIEMTTKTLDQLLPGV